MTKTLALAPFGKNSSLVEFMPLLNAPPEDDFKALGEAAVTLGIDLMKEPFPGEPEELSSAVRQDIWRMWLRSNSKVRDSIILRRNQESGRDNILTSALFIGSFVLTISAGYSVTLFGKDKEMLFLMPPIIMLAVILSAILSCIVCCLKYEKSIRIRELINDNSHSWPYRIVSCLKFAKDKTALLSLEMQALLELIDEVGPESNWGVVLLADQIAMSKLSHSLQSHKDRFSKGFILGLLGENSELVSRVCSAVRPGRLEALMDRIERPDTQYF